MPKKILDDLKVGGAVEIQDESTIAGHTILHEGNFDPTTFPEMRGPIGLPGKDSVVPGPIGPAGADSVVPGPKGEDSVVPGPKGEDSIVPGPKGEDSVVPGPKGEQGEPGKDSVVPGPKGEDSTVPGPVGPAGAASTVPGPKGEDSTVPGPKGEPGKDSVVPGPSGIQGRMAGLRYRYSDSTTPGDPGISYFRFNSAPTTPVNITTIWIDTVTRDSQDMQILLASLNVDSFIGIYNTVDSNGIWNTDDSLFFKLVSKVFDPINNYYALTVQYIAGVADSLVDTNECAVQFALAGPQGEQGLPCILEQHTHPFSQITEAESIEIRKSFKAAYNNNYKEVTSVDGLVQSINIWVDDTKNTALFTRTLSYNAEDLPEVVVTTDILTAKTLTKTITYPDENTVTVTEVIAP